MHKHFRPHHQMQKPVSNVKLSSRATTSLQLTRRDAQSDPCPNPITNLMRPGELKPPTWYAEGARAVDAQATPRWPRRTKSTPTMSSPAPTYPCSRESPMPCSAEPTFPPCSSKVWAVPPLEGDGTANKLAPMNCRASRTTPPPLQGHCAFGCYGGLLLQPGERSPPPPLSGSPSRSPR